MKKSFFQKMVFILLVACLVPQVNLLAQTMQKTLTIAQSAQATIAAITPRTLSLRQGSPAAIVTVDGQYLDSILSAQAVRQGQGVPEIAVKLVQPWPASRKIEIQAGANAPVMQGYQLRAKGKAGFKLFQIDVPSSMFSFEVLTKEVAQMRPVLQPERIDSPNTMSNPYMLLNSYPDLVVDAIRIDPPLPPWNGTGFALYATIKNRGGKEAFLPRGWQLTASRFSGWHPNEFNSDALRPNYSLPPHTAKEVRVFEYRGQEKTPPGTWTVTVRADPENQITEFNEKNNEKSAEITIAAPDLIINNLILEPDNATIAGNFELVAHIMNQGGLYAEITSGEIITELGGHISQVLNPTKEYDIGPGQGIWIRRKPMKLQVGTFTWTLVVDPNNQVVESDENNNTRTIQVTIR